MTIPLIFSLTAHEDHFHTLRSIVLFSLFYALIVYINNQLLIPLYFMTEKYGLYFMSLITLIMLWAIIQAKFDFLFYGCNCVIPLSPNRVTTAGFQVSFFVLAFAAFKLIRDYQEKEKAYEEKERLRAENELTFLRDQINPHFLFNTLNTLYSFALEKSDEVPRFILKLSELMRYMLYECNVKYVSLSKEINYLENYVELQKIRLENRANVKFSVTGDPEGNQIAPSLLITFVENCFTHSLDDQLATAEIKIAVLVEDNILRFKTWNNRPEQGGIENESSGIGLQNVQKRLDLLYPGRYTLQIDSDSGEYAVNLEIDLS